MTNTNINEANRLLSSRVAVYAAPVDEIILEYEVAKEEWLNIAAGEFNVGQTGWSVSEE